MKKRLLLIPLVLGLSLTGCDGTNGDPSSDSPSTTGSSESSGTSSSSATATESEVDNEQDVTSDLSSVKCKSDSKGNWSFEGVVNNTSNESRTFTVAVAVTTGKDIKGHAIITQEVPAKSSHKVAERDFANSTDKAAECEPVLSVAG